MNDHGAENANLALEMAKARSIVGRRPRWIWPSWLFEKTAA